MSTQVRQLDTERKQRVQVNVEGWRENSEYGFDDATQQYGVTSISLLAVRS